MNTYDIIIIGAGPAGLAAAIAAKEAGVDDVLVIERDSVPGGILNQCIHNGFGLHTFHEELTGPEYAARFLHRAEELGVAIRLSTMVLSLTNERVLTVTSRERGVEQLRGRAVILAMGCRERPRGALNIPGYRPAGIYSAGTAQRLVNMEGLMPGRDVVILGSGDIGLIMARRLTLEGAKVLGVYEVKPTPSGLTRNIHQCLIDFDIPLHLSHTVTRVFGEDRLTAVEVAKVDEKMQPIKGTEEIIECDALILSVGLIPENELAESLNVDINRRTKGPVCDQNYMTSVEGIYSAGNCLHVNDLVDYVTENALEAGRNSAHYEKRARKYVPLSIDNNFLYIVPTVLDVNGDTSDVTVYFRASRDMKNARLRLSVDGKEVMTKKYQAVRPPEMERLKINFKDFGVNENSKVEFTLFEEE